LSYSENKFEITEQIKLCISPQYTSNKNVLFRGKLMRSQFKYTQWRQIKANVNF